MKRIVIITEILLAFLMGLIVGAQCRKNLLFLENNIKQIMNLSFSNIKFSERNEEKTAMKLYSSPFSQKQTGKTVPVLCLQHFIDHLGKAFQCIICLFLRIEV